MIEDKNYTDIFIKYISRDDVDIYKIFPIYSVQIPKNYMIDDFIVEIEGKLNTISKKI